MEDGPAPVPAPAGPATGYRERLWPSPGIWLIAVGLAGSFGLVVLPFSHSGALLTALLSAVVLVLLLVAGTGTVLVRDGVLVAGRARVPLSVVGAVEVLDQAAMRAARGPQLDARAYLCLRGWLGSGVRVQIVDATDPTPYWLVSSRRPAALAAAVRSGQPAAG